LLPTSGSPLYTQVGFDNSGKWLVVTDLGDNMILTYPVNSSGMPGALRSSPSSGPAPFGFVFDGRNHLLVVQSANSAVSLIVFYLAVCCLRSRKHLIPQVQLLAG
jgi:6-phosphogluconolactonase (cycloisomerase 2 family)